MIKYKAQYKTEIITSNTSIDPDGFSDIYFENLGDEDITLLNNIPLPIETGLGRSLTNRPYVTIETPIPVTFTGLGTNPKLLVIKTYYIQK